MDIPERKDLLGANLERAFLIDAHLEGANLRGANLEGLTFWKRILKELILLMHTSLRACLKII